MHRCIKKTLILARLVTTNVMRPLGFDWKISVSIITGMAAKEIVANCLSTLGVLYPGDGAEQQSLQTRIKQETYSDGTPVFATSVAAR